VSSSELPSAEGWRLAASVGKMGVGKGNREKASCACVPVRTAEERAWGKCRGNGSNYTVLKRPEGDITDTEPNLQLSEPPLHSTSLRLPTTGRYVGAHSKWRWQAKVARAQSRTSRQGLVPSRALQAEYTDVLFISVRRTLYNYGLGIPYLPLWIRHGARALTSSDASIISGSAPAGGGLGGAWGLMSPWRLQHAAR